VASTDSILSTDEKMSIANFRFPLWFTVVDSALEPLKYVD
jgi:hypothetical protein